MCFQRSGGGGCEKLRREGEPRAEGFRELLASDTRSK